MSCSQQSSKNHIIIDPERLIKLKRQRKAFKMVPSIYQPPQQTYSIAQYQQIKEAKSISSNKVNSTNNIDNQFTPYEKVIQLRQFLSNNNIQKNFVSPNVEYIWSLLPQQYKRDIHAFQEGDCIPQDGSDRWLVLEGQVRIIGVNNHWYTRGGGYIFFASKQTVKKVKQVVAVKSTKMLKIKQQVFKDYLKTYMFLKNSQKIKFLKYCPFFIWKNQLTEDLVLCMDLQVIDRDQNIYLANSKSDAIYFVKEGIVLLQRTIAIQNPIIKDYQMHYEKNQVNQKDAILVVRKGMAFGIDGIILKQIEKVQQSKINLQEASGNIQNIEQFNPENQFLRNQTIRKSTRVYTAKTIGNTQVYVLKKQILETLFTLSDVSDANMIPNREISSQQLERMSIQYTNMIVNHTKRLPLISLKKKDFILPIKQGKNESEQLKQKLKKQFSYKSISLQKNAYKQKRKTIVQDKVTQDFILKEAPLQKNQMRGKSFTNSHKKIVSKEKLGQNQQKLLVQADRKISFPTIKMQKILKSQKARQIFESKLIKKSSKKKQKRLFQKSQSLQKIEQIKNEVQNSYQKSIEKSQNQNSIAFISIKSYKSIINLH